MDTFEIKVSKEEFQRVKARKKEIERLLNDTAIIENALRLIRLNYLLERRDKLRMKLQEVEEHYRSLVEFQERALKDKELFKELRVELSSENAKLRKMLEERNCEDRGSP
ncbi:MAG: hypothetical protein GXO14_03615 [Thermococci archaeon]|nr:hypothetical protein [Thermococci archaeon]